MTISQPNADADSYQQSLINRGYEGHHHYTVEEPGGQTAMRGGTFTPLHSKVSWLGMREDAPKTLLKGMMGLGVAMHGSVPVADDDLSQHGARISRGAARKYGVKAHPENPRMESTFVYDDDDGWGRDDEDGYASEAEREVAGQATLAWQSSNYGDITHMGNQWRSFTPTEVGRITRGVEEDMGLKKPDPRIPVHPSQGKLF